MVSLCAHSMKLDIISSPVTLSPAEARHHPITDAELPVGDDGPEHIYDFIPETYRMTQEMPQQDEGALLNGVTESRYPTLEEVKPKPLAAESAPRNHNSSAQAPTVSTFGSAQVPTASTFGYNRTSHSLRPVVAAAMAVASPDHYAALSTGTLEPKQEYMTIGTHESAIPNPYESLPVLQGQNPYDTPRPVAELPPAEELEKTPADDDEYMEMGSPLAQSTLL